MVKVKYLKMATGQESYSVLQYLEQELADIRAATDQRQLLDMCIGMPQLQSANDVNHIILNSVIFTPECLFDYTNSVKSTPECLFDYTNNCPESRTDIISRGGHHCNPNYESLIWNMKTMDKRRIMMNEYINTYDMLAKQYSEYFKNLQNNTFYNGNDHRSNSSCDPAEIFTNLKETQDFYDCPICGYRCLYESIYHQHMLNHATSVIYSKYKCSKCDYTCERKKSFDSHVESHGTHKLLECRECDYKNISRHQFMVHIEQTDHKCYKCKECGDIFKYKSDLMLHLKNHTFECPTCKQTFTRLKLKTHMWVHIEKPLQCTLCDYKCITKARLKRHMQTHSKNKPFVCTHCARRFSTKYSLKRHSLIHSKVKEKSYKCNECGSTFTSKNGLTYHLKISGHIKSTCHS